MVRLEIKLILCMTFFISVASVNVNGLRKGLKRNILFDYLELRKFSVIFLQETHSELVMSPFGAHNGKEKCISVTVIVSLGG